MLPPLHHLPIEIIFPIFIDTCDRWHMNDVIYHLTSIFGTEFILQNLSSVVVYMLEKDYLSLLPWILVNDDRYTRFFNVFQRHVINDIEKNQNRKTIIKMLDILCKLGRTDLVFKFVNKNSIFYKYLPRDFRTRLCIMGAKYGQLDIVKAYMNDMDDSVDKDDKDDINYTKNKVNPWNRCQMAFHVALSEGQYSVYEELFSIFPETLINWDESEYEYYCAENYDLKRGSYVHNSPLRFLLKNDPRVWHISQKYKKIFVNQNVMKFYRLKKTLRASECVSQRCFANYNPEYDNDDCLISRDE